MKRLEVTYPDGRSHPIVFDRLESLPDHLDGLGFEDRRCVIVTDLNVAAIALEPLTLALERQRWQTSVKQIEPGEASKSAATLAELYDFGLLSRVDRRTPLIALGGGVVGDVAGLCASTLLRGIPLIHVPTTIVSQVDSSIGGKTGINHHSGKNLIGTFYQPQLVLNDARLLQTLPEEEWTSGLAEVVKHALIDSPEHTAYLAESWDDLVRRAPEIVGEVVFRSAGVKVQVVTQDERESGRRAILNFGHTTAHGIERAADYGVVSHGHAVAAGMAVALRISDSRYLTESRDDAWQLVRRLGWPSLARFDIDEVEAAIAYDKKHVSGSLRFILLPRTGRPEICTDVSRSDIRAAWKSLARNT